MYHAYEYSLVQMYSELTDSQKKLYAFNRCESYIRDMNDYKHGGKDMYSFIEYYTQSLEVDSNHYAGETMHIYYRMIDELQVGLTETFGEILDK